MSLLEIFQVKKFKQQIENHTYENDKLKKEINTLNERLNFNLSMAQMEPIKLEALITEKNKKIEHLDMQIDSHKYEISNLNEEIKNLSDQLNTIKADISDLSPSLEMSSYGLYEPHYDFATSLEYKDRLKEIRDLQKEMVKTKNAVIFNDNWTVNGSIVEGRKMNRNNIKSVLRSFNNECTDAINKVTYSNSERIKTRIIRSFDQHNKMQEVNEIYIVNEYKELKLQELYLAFEYKQKVQEEKDILREERAKEKEEKALQRDIDKQRKKIDKEINHYSNAVLELQEKLDNDQNNLELQEEIQKLKNELVRFNKQKEDVDYRENNATAGYVYIISNVGSFGKDVVKIGVTRRLDPTDRVNELGSASVPFKFDIHALIFSEDAYQLESELHKKFDSRRVNKVNSRKEYFNISIEEIEEELKKYKNVTVDFNKVPEAEEYRTSSKIMFENSN